MKNNRRVYLNKGIFCLFICVCFISCFTLFTYKKSIPSNLTVYNSGIFSGSIILAQNKKKYYLDVDIAISNEGVMRLDLTASLGISLLSLLLTKEEGILLLFQQKQFYRGKNPFKWIKRFVPIPVDLRIFKDILFDRRPSALFWSCLRGNNNQLVECEYKNTKIQWDRKNTRNISITHSQFKLVFHYSSFTLLLDQKRLKLDIPPAFKPLLLPSK